MTFQRIGGLGLLVGGVVLFIVGMNASDSFADQWSNFFTGRFTDTTVWYIAGGIVLGLAGLSMLLVHGRTTSAR